MTALCASTIMLPATNHREVVPINEIVYLEGQGNYTEFTFINGRTALLAAITLKRYEERLAQSVQFFRISKSIMVNIKFVVACTTGIEPSVRLHNGQEFQMSRRRAMNFKSQFESIT